MNTLFLAIAVAACAIACQGPTTSLPTPTAAATPTATATPLISLPPPQPTLWASAEAKECLLNPYCSGLFTTGHVRKARVLTATRFGLQPARYWVGSRYDLLGMSTIEEVCSSLPDAEEKQLSAASGGRDCIERRHGYMQYYTNLMRYGIMPVIEQWTHRPWAEVTGPEPVPGALLLRWYDHVPQHWDAPAATALECGTLNSCAMPGLAQIVLRQDDVPLGLHEALHALFYAEHTAEGLMSPDLGTYSLRHAPLEHEVYSLYGSPWLTHGMSRDTVEQIILTEGPRTTSGRP